MNRREIDALAALDRRAERAAHGLVDAIAAELRRRPDTAVVPPTANGSDPPAPAVRPGAQTVAHVEVGERPGSDGPDGRDPTTIKLHEARPTRPRHPRRWAAAAAAVAAISLLVAGLALLRDGGEDDSLAVDAPDTPTDILMPGWLPDEWEARLAFLVGDARGEGTIAGEVVVYGDTRLADPWAGPRLTAIRSDQPVNDMATAHGEPEDYDSITLAGQEAFLLSDDGRPVAWTTEGELTLGIEGVHVPATLVADAGRHLSDEPSIDGDGLPDGFAEIARGPLGAVGPGAGNGVDLGMTIVYGDPSEMYGIGLTVTQQPADAPDAAALLRLLVDEPVGVEVVETEVRGQPAYLVNELVESFGDGTREGVLEQVYLTADGPTSEDSTDLAPAMVQWFEPATRMVITVRAEGVDRATWQEFLDGLRLANADERDDIRDRHDTSLEDFLSEVRDRPDRSPDVPMSGM